MSATLPTGSRRVASAKVGPAGGAIRACGDPSDLARFLRVESECRDATVTHRRTDEYEVIMTGGTNGEPDEAERLKELGHLSAAVGHHVINAFSAVVSNAELIRSHARSVNCDLDELAALGSAIIENALSASH